MGAITIFADNQGAIALAKDNKFHARTKHIDLRYHFVCEAVEDRKIKLEYIPTAKNIADIFTKPLPKPKFTELVKRLGLSTIKDPSCTSKKSGQSLINENNKCLIKMNHVTNVSHTHTQTRLRSRGSVEYIYEQDSSLCLGFHAY